MEELIVPLIVLAVLAAIVFVGVLVSRAAGDPQDNWRAAAERFGLAFEARDKSAAGMRLTGQLDGGRLEVVSRLVNQRFGQIISDFELELPDTLPRAIVIERAISAFAAKRRGRAENPYEGRRRGVGV